MALMITDDCTNCDACVSVCPNNAIFEGDIVYEIDKDRCTECVGAEDEPQCILVCPVDSIEPDPHCREDKDALLAKYQALQAAS